MTSCFHGDQARLGLLIKRKRTKRQRSASPLMNVSSVCEEQSSSSSPEEEACTNEDEDMANCLMLLSQGHKPKSSDNRQMSFLSDKKPMASLGFELDGVYKCKTCNKRFHSFQALGGHRASHKKPKLEKIPASAVETVEAGVVGSFLSLQVTSNDGNKKQEKTHECSICKADFSSGQALGGHMRRHRGLILNANANPTSTTKTAISSSSSSHHQYQEPIRLELDLNLPAPEDESKFVFVSKDHILSFMATSNSLIDCHH